jgi:hypothetical protein
MVQYLRSDATCLSDNDIQDIINARNSMKRASEVMADKYKISSRRVYQIWRGVHPPIDPTEDTVKDITSGSKGFQNQVKKTEVKKTKSTHTSEPFRSQSVQKEKAISSARGAIGDTKSKRTGTTSDDHILNALFEKEARRDEKNKINGTHLLTHH